MPEPWQELAVKYVHPRDASIVFDEPTHVYTVKGSSKGYISVTKFLHEFFPHFDAAAVIAKMMASPKWPQSKYFGKTSAEIQKEWSDSGRVASAAGTALHLAIEQYLNGHAELIPHNVLATPEWNYFENFWKETKEDLVPYRTEWEIWAEEYKLAGSLDMVFYRKSDDSYLIYDWKRSKEIKMENRFESGFGPVEHLPDCNYWHYTLQLNIYRFVLERFYGLRISEMYLVIMHPDNKNYHRYRLNRLEKETEDMFAARKAAVEAGAGTVKF